MRGKFITLEGIDGAGKSTHLDWLVATLRARGLEVVRTREPGGTPLGEKLRALLLSEPMDIDTETLLMFAARREHLAQVIGPALGNGHWVVSDRFTDATFAYQGGGRGLDWSRIATLERWVQGELQPDLTLVFDVPVDVAAARLKTTGIAPDRFEREQSDFFARVRDGYLRRISEFPSRFRLVDARKSVPEIQKELEKVISTI